MASLGDLRARIDALDEAIAETLALHPDAAVFTSLPRAGTNRAALLLAEIGDCRARFPDDTALAAAAGVAPSTRASGKRHHVAFRHSCDKKLREALIDFAADSRQASPWAAEIYQRARDRGARHPGQLHPWRVAPKAAGVPAVAHGGPRRRLALQRPPECGSRSPSAAFPTDPRPLGTPSTGVGRSPGSAFSSDGAVGRGSIGQGERQDEGQRSQVAGVHVLGDEPDGRQHRAPHRERRHP